MAKGSKYLHIMDIGCVKSEQCEEVYPVYNASNDALVVDSFYYVIDGELCSNCIALWEDGR